MTNPLDKELEELDEIFESFRVIAKPMVNGNIQVAGKIYDIDILPETAMQAALIAWKDKAVKEARIDELIWSTGVEYKYDRDRKMIQDRIKRLEKEGK